MGFGGAFYFLGPFFLGWGSFLGSCYLTWPLETNPDDGTRPPIIWGLFLVVPPEVVPVTCCRCLLLCRSLPWSEVGLFRLCCLFRSGGTRGALVIYTCPLVTNPFYGSLPIPIKRVCYSRGPIKDGAWTSLGWSGLKKYRRR